MYLTVCPLRDPGHDSSVGEWMHLTVYPLHSPGHDSSMGKWMHLTVCPSCSTPSHDSKRLYLTDHRYPGRRGPKARTTVVKSGMSPLRKMPSIMGCLWIKPALRQTNKTSQPHYVTKYYNSRLCALPLWSFLFRMEFFYHGRLDWDANSTSGRYVREMCKPIFVSLHGSGLVCVCVTRPPTQTPLLRVSV